MIANTQKLLLFILLSLPVFASAKAQLSPGEYKLLTRAGTLLQEDKQDEAYLLLLKGQESVRSRYGKALVQHNLGQVELHREKFSSALQYLQQAYRMNALPDSQQLDLQRTLSQLHCMEEQWQPCIALLQDWMTKASEEAPDKILAGDYLLLAQAQSQIEHWSSVVESLSRAVQLRTAKKESVPEGWYQLKVVAHIQLKQWPDAIRDQQRLIEHYANKSEYWRQLVSMHQQNKDPQSALSAQRIAYEQGLLDKASDYRLLAQMLLQDKLPFFAGQVIEQGIEKGLLKPGKKNLELLGHCWMQARETKRAISVLVELNRINPDQERTIQLAYLQMELRQWQAANSTLEQALQKKAKNPAKLQLMLGITRIKLKRYKQARQVLHAAAGNRNLKTTAESWLRYLKQISPA